MNVRVLVCAFSLFAATSSTAFATPITYNYTGTVISTTGIFAGQGTDVVTGTFTFDNTAVDLFSSLTGLDEFPASPASNNEWETTLELGAVELTTATNARTAVQHHSLGLVDSGGADIFSFRVFLKATGDDGVELRLEDLLPTPPDGIASGSNGLTGSMADAITILNSLDPAAFSNNFGQSGWSARNDQTGEQEGLLIFTLTSISPAQPVPEPASLLLFGTGLAAAGIRRYRRKQ